MTSNDRLAYLACHVPDIEKSLSAVVNDVISEQLEDPLVAISTRLYEKYGNNGTDLVKLQRAARSSKEVVAVRRELSEAVGEAESAKSKPDSTEQKKLDANEKPKFTCSRGHSEELPAAIKVATSTAKATGVAMFEAARSLYDQLAGTADLVLCFCTEHHACADVETVARELFGSVPFAANTTHGGLVTTHGWRG